MEIYYPIRDQGQNEVRAVFETYLATGALNKHVSDALTYLFFGLALLTGLLVVFAHVASQILLDRNDRLREKTNELAKSEEQFRRIANILQESLIRPVPDIPGLSTCVGYESAFEAETVGGHFYDIFELGPDLTAILIGDVSGHGVEAAGLTETVRSAVRTAAHINQSPSFILSKVNEVLVQQLDDSQFVTAILMTVDTTGKIARLANAGHPPPLILGADSHFFETKSQLPLGVMSGEYSESRIELNQGDAVIFYTDGLMEAKKGQSRFGLDRIYETVRDARTAQPGLLIEKLLNEATGFSRGRLQDDVAIVAIRLR